MQLLDQQPVEITNSEQLAVEAEPVVHEPKPIALPDLGSTAIDDSLSIGEVAFAVLRRHFAAFLARQAGTRLGEDIEELHAMRVATRRLRAAMSLFADVLPGRAGRLRQELGWIAGALGAVRDLDVQIAQVNTWLAEEKVSDGTALQALTSLFEGQRARARKRLLGVLDSRRYARFVAAYTTLLQRGPQRSLYTARVPVLAVAPDLIGRRYRTARKAGDAIADTSSPADYHALRIKCKRLRYALEFLSDVYGKPAQALARRLVAVQDILGLHQDAQVAIARLRELSVARGSKLPPQTIFIMGEIVQRYTQQAAELRTQFPEAYRELKGEPWKRLRQVMDKRRVLPWKTRP